MSTKWRIYCKEPGFEGFQTVWSDTPPTLCPEDPAHAVNPNSISEVAKEVIVDTITPSYTKPRSKYFTRVITLMLDSNAYTLRKIRLFSKVDVGAAGYTVELFDRDTRTSLAQATFTNTKLAEVDMPIITLNPGVNRIDVNVKYEPSLTRPSRRYRSLIDKILIIAEV